GGGGGGVGCGQAARGCRVAEGATSMAHVYPLDSPFAPELAARRRAPGCGQNRTALAAGLAASYLQKVETPRPGIAPDVRATLGAALQRAEGRLPAVAHISGGELR